VRDTTFYGGLKFSGFEGSQAELSLPSGKSKLEKSLGTGNKECTGLGSKLRYEKRKEVEQGLHCVQSDFRH
jgi:hypothetical protein